MRHWQCPDTHSACTGSYVHNFGRRSLQGHTQLGYSPGCVSAQRACTGSAAVARTSTVISASPPAPRSLGHVLFSKSAKQQNDSCRRPGACTAAPAAGADASAAQQCASLLLRLDAVCHTMRTLFTALVSAMPAATGQGLHTALRSAAGRSTTSTSCSWCCSRGSTSSWQVWGPSTPSRSPCPLPMLVPVPVLLPSPLPITLRAVYRCMQTTCTARLPTRVRCGVCGRAVPGGLQRMQPGVPGSQRLPVRDLVRAAAHVALPALPGRAEHGVHCGAAADQGLHPERVHCRREGAQESLVACSLCIHRCANRGHAWRACMTCAPW